MPYGQWIDAVNDYLCDKVGVTTDDLPDCCYADWYDDGMSPRQAAREALALA